MPWCEATHGKQSAHPLTTIKTLRSYYDDPKHAFGLSARAIDINEMADILAACETLFTLDNGSSRTFVLSDQNGMDLLAIQDGFDGGAILVELADSHESIHHYAREVLNRVF